MIDATIEEIRCQLQSHCVRDEVRLTGGQKQTLKTSEAGSKERRSRYIEPN